MARATSPVGPPADPATTTTNGQGGFNIINGAATGVASTLNVTTGLQTSVVNLNGNLGLVNLALGSGANIVTIGVNGQVAGMDAPVIVTDSFGSVTEASRPAGV